MIFPSLCIRGVVGEQDQKLRGANVGDRGEDIVYGCDTADCRKLINLENPSHINEPHSPTLTGIIQQLEIINSIYCARRKSKG